MFEVIRSQDEAIHQMEAALARPVNTYVFYASRGTYAEEAARIFAARLIDPSGDIDERALKQHYVDIVEFEPSGVSYRVKEDVREGMLEELRKTPIESIKKVLIVHDAHLLRSDSANTLLKSLEEPPENTHWILIAPSPDMLIETIRSRCFSIEFARLRPDLIEEVLRQEGVDAERAQYVSTHCSGRLDRARKLAREYYPIVQCSYDIVNNHKAHVSAINQAARTIIETMEEISSDVIARNKTELETLKKEMKDSGYSDKVAQSIVSSTKARIEASEKKLKSDMILEFLDTLQGFYTELSTKIPGQAQAGLAAARTIDEYRKRLVYNPGDMLFFESLLASISTLYMEVRS